MTSRALALLLSGILLASLAPRAAASPAKLENLVKDLESTKKSLVEDEVKQRKIMSSLFEVNRKMKKIVNEHGDLVQERFQLETTNRELSQKIDSLVERVRTQKAFLRQRISLIYRFGGQGIARVVFSSHSSSDLEKNLKILGVIAKRDLDLIKDYSGSVNELAKKRERLTQRLAHLKKVESGIRNKEERLTQENNYKNRILEGIRKSKKFALLKLSGLREKTSQLSLNDDSGVLDLLFRPSFFEKKGQLPAPVTGTILQKFGLLRDEEHNVSLSHKGIFYAVPRGSLVRAVFAGKVAFSGVIPGYGNSLVIDHGDHYYTVYSHNEVLNVSAGAEIQQSQVVAVSGASSERFGEGIYFEVRHFSEPYDPQTWMKGSL